jgi:3D (Asp-Asp-Asp) domain-containing protein
MFFADFAMGVSPLTDFFGAVTRGPFRDNDPSRRWRMLTRSVVAYMVSGTLVSVVLLGGPLTMRAEESAVEAAATTPHQSRDSEKTGEPVWEGQPSSSRGDTFPVSNSSASLTAAVSLEGQPPDSPTIHLGTFTVRAYTHYHRPGAKPNTTAIGTVPTAGRTVAVDPRVIPLGSKIHIAGVGERIAEDTGGKIRGRKLDLFLPSVKECRQFGVRRQEVRLLED